MYPRSVPLTHEACERGRQRETALTRYLIAIEELDTYTLAEASAITGYDQKHLNNIARNGSLGAYKDGRNWKVTKEDLERYIQESKR